MTESMQMPDASTIEAAQTPASAPAKRRAHWLTAGMWFVVLGVLAMLGWGLVNSTSPRPEVGEPAPDFNLEFFEGYEWNGRAAARLSDMRGSIIVLNFWASWCAECRYEAEVLENASRKYADDGVIFLGVAYADVEPNSLAYMREFNVSYPHAPDLGTDISQDYEITGVPETFIIGPDGKIVYFQLGPLNQATLEGTIDQLLEGG